MAGACSNSHSRLIKFLGESGAAFYHRDDDKHLFSFDFTVFMHLTSYPFPHIRTDMEKLASLNRVSILGARAPFSVCVIDVTGYVYEFDQAFTHYLATLPEYKVVCTASFGDDSLAIAGQLHVKPHAARVTRLAKTGRDQLSFPVRWGEEQYLRTCFHRVFRAPLAILMDVMRHVAETHAELPENHRRRALTALHPDYRSLLPEAESLALRAVLINSARWSDTPPLGKSPE